MEQRPGQSGDLPQRVVHWQDAEPIVTILSRFTAPLLLALAMFACPLSQASTQPAHTLVFAFSELEPWKTMNGDQFGGAYTEIVRELARRADMPLKIVPCPLPRCLVMLEQGSADIAIGIAESRERGRFLHFLKTAYRTRGSDKVFYVRKGMGQAIRSYDDLKPLRIGVKQGASAFARFEADTTLNKIAARDVATNFRKLALGRIDALVVAEDQGEAILSQLKLREQLEKASYRFVDTVAPRAVSVSKKTVNEAQRQVLESAMADMVKDGTLTKLFRRHYYDVYQIPPNSVPGL